MLVLCYHIYVSICPQWVCVKNTSTDVLVCSPQELNNRKLDDH